MEVAVGQKQSVGRRPWKCDACGGLERGQQELLREDPESYSDLKTNRHKLKREGRDIIHISSTDIVTPNI